MTNEPFKIESMIQRVFLREIRSPSPYTPPIHPVLTNQTDAPLCSIRFAKSCAYLLGCQTKKAAPKQSEEKLIDVKDNKKKIDKAKTILETDREKLDAKFSKKNKTKLN